MSETRAAVLVRLSAGLKLRLAELARREHRSLSQQVEFLLERCLEMDKEKESTAQPARKANTRRGAE